MSTDTDRGGGRKFMGDIEARKQTALRLMNAIATADRDAMEACIGPDPAWWFPPVASRRGLPRPFLGRTAIIDLLCSIPPYEPGTMQWDVHQVIAEDDMVAVNASLDAVALGGAEYHNAYALVYRFDNERIVECWEHCDTLYSTTVNDG